MAGSFKFESRLERLRSGTGFRLLKGESSMIASVNGAVAALQAYRTKLGVTAYNIANVNTEAFKKSRASLVESSNGGVEVNIQSIDTPGYRFTELEGDQVVDKESSNVDLGEELTEMMITRRGYQANLKTLQAHDDMLGTLLDILS
jgi:flagellar basal-body rod protein FlgC